MNENRNNSPMNPEQLRQQEVLELENKAVEKMLRQQERFERKSTAAAQKTLRQIRELSHQVEVAVIPRSIDCIDVGSLLVIAAECPRIIVGCAAGNHHVLSPVVVGGDGLVLADLSVRIGGIGALLN